MGCRQGSSGTAVGIIGLHIERAVVVVDTYEKYQLDVYIYDLGTVKKTNQNNSFYHTTYI
jgi:hypothetical protein